MPFIMLNALKTIKLSKKEKLLLEFVNQLTPKEFNVMLEHAKKTIKKNRSMTLRETGDRVMVWDTSRLMQYDINLNISEDFESSDIEEWIICNNPSYVARTGEKFKSTVFGKTFILDLIIFSPKLNKHFRTSSEFVKSYNI